MSEDFFPWQVTIKHQIILSENTDIITWSECFVYCLGDQCCVYVVSKYNLHLKQYLCTAVGYWYCIFPSLNAVIKFTVLFVFSLTNITEIKKSFKV